MKARFKIGDIVFFGDRRLKVAEGPFRTLDCPAVDQYILLGGANGKVSAWDTDLTSQEEREEEARNCE